ncbi:dihydroxyacetone kinase phosphoryl donor subunit DhaM [Dermacoccaceae bacterium W4C1]
MTVGLVLVSHSAALATGLAELAGQMAPEVTLVPAGGDDSGGLGTSVEIIENALARADSGAGVVVLYDLGSAQMTAEMATELADSPERIRVLDAPLVEGALAAAVSAQAGDDLEAVAAAVLATATTGSPQTPARDGASEARAATDQRVHGDVELINPMGLHARPAAALARLLTEHSATGRVRCGERSADIASVLSVVGLSTRAGDVVQVEIDGSAPDPQAALQAALRLIGSGFGEDRAEQEPAAAGPLGVSPGLAIGRLIELSGTPRELPATAPTEISLAQLRAARDATARRLSGGEDLDRAHAAIVLDPHLWAAVEHHRDSPDGDQADRDAATGSAADDADGPRLWWAGVNQVADELADSPDAVLAARAVDVREAGAAVLRDLGIDLHAQITAETVRDAVVLMDDAGPAQTNALVRAGAAAVVLRGGQRTAHAVIVARGQGIPMVIRAGSALDDHLGSTLVLDGGNGGWEVDPDAERLAQVQAQLGRVRHRQERLREQAATAVTFAGKPVLIAANISSAQDARAAVASGADAIGLLRTEVMLLESARIPTEDEQVEQLQEVLESVGDRPVVIRVLDAGGDKPVAALALSPRNNGFLGERGLRYLLSHPDLLRTQVRAVLRAGVGHRVSVMAPMVTTAAEAAAFRAAVQDAAAELRSEAIAFAVPEGIGVMVEVPAAALSVPELAPHVDFLSVGTNDLIGYLTATDRTLSEVAELADPDSVALWRLLRRITADAREHGLPVAVCGELAADPQRALALLELGVSEVSMAPAAVPGVKAAVRGHRTTSATSG